MTKSSWRCCKKVWLALSVAITMVVMLGNTSPAFAQDPAQALYDAAIARHEWGDYDRAMVAFEKFLAQHPESDLAGDAQYVLGQVYVRLERYDDAIFAFYTAAYKYPRSNRSDDALIALAGSLYRQDYMPQALDAYEQLAKEYPQSKHAAYAQTCIGWLYGSMGNTEKAKAVLKKVATHYPDSPYVETARKSLKKLGGQPTEWTGLSPKLREPQPEPQNVASVVSDGNEKVKEAVAVTVKAAAPPPPPSVSSIIHQTLLLDSIPPTSQNQKNTFSPGDMIYVWVESRVLNKPHKLEIAWMDPSGKEVKRETFDLRGWGARETFWSELQTGRQMMQGRWKIVVLIDGRVHRAMYALFKP